MKQRGYTTRFSLAVAEEANAFPPVLSPTDLEGRRDLRGDTILTIDGADAKDLDDAISITKAKDGSFCLGVHIADVSHYVTVGSALDEEAFTRGTSVYLVDTVVPMLPTQLSNGICSLHPDVDRLTLSVFMTISKGGDVVSYEICPSVIRSKARMTYAKVTEILDGTMAARNQYRDLIPTFERMRELALLLRDRRMERGAIDFDIPEAQVTMADDGTVADIGIHPITVSNKIIEEFMLIANETVAKHLVENRLPGVFRVHEPPDEAKAEAFGQLVRGLGYPFRAKKEILPKTMQQLLFRAEGSPQMPVISTMMLRSMMKARYDGENLGHFGLAADYYCHFTSPIRRYPDLMVHRILKESLERKMSTNRRREYDVLTRTAAQQSSQTEADAVMAERDFVDGKMCEFMQDKVGMQYPAIICSVTSFGFFVQLPNLVEGLVRMVDLKDDYYLFDETRMVLVGKRGGRCFQMGQQLSVRLAKVNVELNQIDFVLAEAPQQKGQKPKKEAPPHDRKSKPKGGKKGHRPKQKGIS